MKYDKAFSLSLQREMESRDLAMDSEINKAFEELKFRSLLNRCRIMKKKGYLTIDLLYLMVLLPFLREVLTILWSRDCFNNAIEARKDTYYRFLNQERFNWRKFIYLLFVRLISMKKDVPLKDKVLIADDSITPKTGNNMELVSYHFDHKVGRSILGYLFLVLGYHEGTNFYPIDIGCQASSKRPNSRMREIDRRTNGWRRRKEALKKKTDVLIDMVQRAWLYGIDASFVLFDSWFAHDAVISQINCIGYGVICRLKKGKVKYTYEGQSYTLKQLWKEVAKKRTQWLSEFGLKGVCLNVRLPKSGEVRILFVSDGKKQWQAFLSTDLDLEASKILEYYARRWAIEIFFKDTKQMLYFGKDQSETFDAVIASCSLVLIRYLLLVYILNKYHLTGPIGPLFRELVEKHVQLYHTEKTWAYIKGLMIIAGELLLPEMDCDRFLNLLEIVENATRNRFLLPSEAAVS